LREFEFYEIFQGLAPDSGEKLYSYQLCVTAIIIPHYFSNTGISRMPNVNAYVSIFDRISVMV